MLNRKCKMVSFRLSSEEYQLLREACEVNGVRSISELARMSMQHLVTAHNGADAPVGEQLRALRERARVLSIDIERLARHIGSNGN